MVGAVVIAGCVAVGVATAGLGGLACVTAAGALAGGVYGGMTCQDDAMITCVGEGALTGGVAGLAGGVTVALGGGALAAGAMSGFFGDATTQLTENGRIDDPKELVTATLFSGIVGWAGGKLTGGRNQSELRRPVLDDPAYLPSEEPLPISKRVTGDCGTPNSFTPGTPVLMADGSSKPIEDVAVGDQILATDPGHGRDRKSMTLSMVERGGGVAPDVDVEVAARMNILLLECVCLKGYSQAILSSPTPTRPSPQQVRPDPADHPVRAWQARAADPHLRHHHLPHRAAAN